MPSNKKILQKQTHIDGEFAETEITNAEENLIAYFQMLLEWNTLADCGVDDEK